MAGSVYLGFIDEEILQKDDVDPFCTKVGGYPVWLLDKSIDIPRCGICNSLMYLVVQAYSPLNKLPTHERVLYIFCCIKSGCSSQSSGWCVLRLQALVSKFEDETVDITNKTQQNDTWESDWEESDTGTKTTDILDNTSNAELEDLLLLRDMSLNSNSSSSLSIKKKNNLKNDNSTQQSASFFVPYYLTVTEETFESHTTITSQPIRDSSDIDSEWAGEEYEYTPDRIMSKFFKRLALNPTQCLRYNFNGTPLLMYPDPALSNIPPCTLCGEPRVFELQLLSTLIYLLNSRNKKCDLDFGIVAVFVCSNSCTLLDVQQEYVYVQPENK